MRNSKEQRLKFVHSALIAGIDVGKFNYLSSLQLSRDKELNMSKFSNTTDDFEDFLNTMNQFKEKYKCNRIVAALEPTGHYWENLAYWLDAHQVPLVNINTLYTKRAKDLENNSPGKTDPKDARIIADLTSQGKFLRCILPKGIFAELRELSKLREQLVVDLNRKTNILHTIMDGLFPGFSNCFSDLLGKSSLYLILHYPTPEELLKLGEDRLTKELHKVSRGKIGQEKAQLLLAKAKVSPFLKEAMASRKLSLKLTLRSISILKEQIADVEKELTDKLKLISYSKYLLSIKGIGVITLACILGETGDLKDYRVAEEVIKLAGLNLYEVSSGTHKGRKRITKRGRALLRKLLYLAVLRLIHKDGLFYPYYQHLLQERKMIKNKAIVACMRKLLRIIFALARDERNFSQIYLLRKPIKENRLDEILSKWGDNHRFDRGTTSGDLRLRDRLPLACLSRPGLSTVKE